jgi:hypothetical protein
MNAHHNLLPLSSQALQALLVFIRPDKAKPVVIRDISPNAILDLFIHHDAFCQFLANILLTLRAVIQTYFDDARPDRAGPVISGDITMQPS